MSYWECDRCQRDFVSAHARYQHWMNHPNHNLCTSCEDDFYERDELVYHHIDVHGWIECEQCVHAAPNSAHLHNHYAHSHPYCIRCQRLFGSTSAFTSHNNAVHPLCAKCDTRFDHGAALATHWRTSSMHHWCHLCNSHLDSENALQEHRERQHFACKTCSATHSNQQELHVHRTSQHHLCQRCDSEHASAVELHHHRVDLHFLCTLCQDQHISQQELDDHRVSAHAWCIPCGRSFQNSNNLKQHQNSKQHKQKSVNCPMKECSASFVSLSALIAHAESGGCVSGVTRREIDRSVVAADINGVITEHRRIMGPAGVSAYPFDQDTKYQATEHAWNGRAFECYLCHRTFRQLKDLNAHLGSSAHTGAHIYHCPPRGCGKTFSTLSSLMRHIEDESCGVRRFRFVERAIEESVGQFSQIKTISSAGRSLVHSSTINSSSRFSPY